MPIAAGAENFTAEAVDRVLSRQHYRLAYWRKAADAINYCRFFDISDLVSLRAEHDDVFQATHARAMKFIGEGKVSGLRIDHVLQRLVPDIDQTLKIDADPNRKFTPSPAAGLDP